MFRSAVPYAAIAALVLAVPGARGEDLPVRLKAEGTVLTVEPLADGYANFTLTVAGPGGYYVQTHSGKGPPSLDLKRSAAPVDGLYTFQLTGSALTGAPAPATVDNGRLVKPAAAMRAASHSGTFRVQGGAIVIETAVRNGGSRQDQR